MRSLAVAVVLSLIVGLPVGLFLMGREGREGLMDGAAHGLLNAVTRSVTVRVEAAGAPLLDGKPVDLVAVVRWVVDGDTFFGFPSGRVRLADINTPERGQPGYLEAAGALRGLVEGKAVYLDVDGHSVEDQHGRLVAVVYVDYNATHALNVNLWLVRKGLAEVRDFPNEFSPSEWKLYVPRGR